MNIGFFVNHFTERGTEVAIYDYAKYNEEILNNKSFIICFKQESQKYSYNLFNERFKIIKIQNINDMKDIIKDFNLSFFYTLVYGSIEYSCQFYPSQTKILDGRTNISGCVFEALFKGVSTRFGLRIAEECFESASGNVGSDFQNLRLGSINLIIKIYGETAKQ